MYGWLQQQAVIGSFVRPTLRSEMMRFKAQKFIFYFQRTNIYKQNIRIFYVALFSVSQSKSAPVFGPMRKNRKSILKKPIFANMMYTTICRNRGFVIPQRAVQILYLHTRILSSRNIILCSKYKIYYYTVLLLRDVRFSWCLELYTVCARHPTGRRKFANNAPWF